MIKKTKKYFNIFLNSKKFIFLLLIIISIFTLVQNRNHYNYYDHKFYTERFNNYKLKYEKEDYLINVTENKVGYNYYADLARGIVDNRSFSLPGPYHENLSDEVYPYGKEALNKKIIIQDASYYKGLYYLYWGHLPVIFYIVPYYFFDFLPSDFLMSSIILLISLLALVVFSWKVLSDKSQA